MNTESASSKIAAALRQRFGSDPRAVLRKLGLDEDLIPKPRKPGDENLGGSRSGGPLKEFAAELQSLLADLDLDEGQREKVQNLLNKHITFDRSRRLGSDDESAEKFTAFLRSLGLNDEDVAEALRLATSTNGNADDTLPRNALRRSAMDALAFDRRLSSFEERFPEVARIKIC
jgi:hypothetical protein